MDTKRNNSPRMMKPNSRVAPRLMKNLTGVLLGAALITAALVFQFVRDLLLPLSITRPPGTLTPIIAGNEGTIVPPDTPMPPPLEDEFSIESGSRVNVLILGLDKADWDSPEREGPPKTDSMILATYDPATESAAMLSIPRDLWVNVPVFGQYKINQAYALGEGALLPGGGSALAVKTVEEFLGIDIHYYVQIDFQAFIDFIDFIGGVCVQVENRIELDVQDKFVDVILEPGERCMKGDHLLAYIRNRYVSDGDFDRARRQQQVILAIQDRILTTEVQGMILNDPRGLWDIFSSGIQTNIPFDVALSLGLDALKINPEQIGRYVIAPPQYVQHATSPDGKQEILKPITANIRVLRDEVFTSMAGPAAKGDPLELMKAEEASVGVYNGSSVGGLAGSTQEYLNSLGFDVIEVGNASFVGLTTIYDYTGNPYTVQYLIDLMGINNTRIFYHYDPNSPIDVGIELGDDWDLPNT